MRFLFCAVLVAAAATPAAAAPCSTRIAFVHRVIDKDVKIGFVDKKVHDAMTADLDQATKACDAGDEATAQKLISSTQARHGYPVRGQPEE
jgi:hypothetical protein